MCHFTDCWRIQRIINVTEWFPFTNMSVFFGKIMLSGLVFIAVHGRCTGNFALKMLRTGTTKRFCCDLYGTDISKKL